MFVLFPYARTFMSICLVVCQIYELMETHEGMHSYEDRVRPTSGDICGHVDHHSGTESGFLES